MIIIVNRKNSLVKKYFFWELYKFSGFQNIFRIFIQKINLFVIFLQIYTVNVTKHA
jgi:hypothetical protein